jgi:predicted DsbA family dithiol-disulfide isomerase
MQIDVWSDYACPWCALGLARLRVALRDFAHGDEVSVVHRAYELHPGAPARSTPSVEEAVARKYGLPLAQVRAGHAQLTAFGAEVGFTFDFGRVQPGNTFDAHRLTEAVRGTGREEALVAALFTAYFSEGRQLSDASVLRDVASSVGVPAATVDTVCGADEAAARELGVTGVPYFLIGGVWPIPGAQDVETLGIVLARAWSRLAQ